MINDIPTFYRYALSAFPIFYGVRAGVSMADRRYVRAAVFLVLGLMAVKNASTYAPGLTADLRNFTRRISAEDLAVARRRAASH